MRPSARIPAFVIGLSLVSSALAQTPLLVLVFPNGGETLQAGSAVKIRWTTLVDGPVYLYVGKGGNYTQIGETAITAGEYTWNICPEMLDGDDYSIQMGRSIPSGTIWVTSASTFSITGGRTAPQVAPVAPAAAETFVAGQSTTIEWTATGATSDISMRLSNGSGQTMTIGYAPASVGRYDWDICLTLTPRADYRVFYDYTDSCGHYTSIEGPKFTIDGSPAGDFTITSPRGGEVWTAGTRQLITWQPANADCGLYLSLLRAGQEVAMVGFPLMEDGQFLWDIDPAIGDAADYCIQFEWFDCDQIVRYTTEKFSIIGSQVEPSIHLLAPNGGETIVAGQPYQIAWHAANLQHERPGWEWPNLSLVKANDWHEQSISFSYYAGEEAVWYVCPYTPPGNDYRLRIYLFDGDRLVEDFSGAPFTITGSSPEPTFTITAPLSGSTVVAGEPLTVNWTSTATEGDVYLELYKGGTHYSDLGTANASVGTLTSTVCPYVEDGSDYVVWLRWSSCGEPVNAASESFSITGGQPRPTLTITSPAAGESWQAGTTHTITWTSTNPEGWVYVTIWRDGLPAIVPTLRAPMTDGRVDWVICPFLPAGGNYRVRLSWYDCAQGGSAESPGSFTIMPGVAPPPVLHVLSPVGGESWQAGTRQTVRWSAENARDWVTLSLFKGGEYLQSIGSALMADGCFEWDICSVGTDASDYTVQVEWGDCGCPWVTATSPSAFSLTGLQPEPTIQFLSPVEGDVLAAGTRQTIAWSSTNPAGDVSMQLLKGGLPFAHLGFAAMADGRLDWDICPAAPDGDDYSIAFAWTTCLGSHTLVSPGKFSITAAPGSPPMPTLELTRPLGGEHWTAGTTEQITWTSTNPAGDVLIYVLCSDPWKEQYLGTASMAAGSFNWSIPACTLQGWYLVLLYPACGRAVSNDWIRLLPSATVPAADLNGNCAVDDADFDVFRACLSGPAVLYNPSALPPRCSLTPDAQGRIAADFDKDGDVDQDDFGAFQRCFRGAGSPGNSSCAN